MFTVGCYFTYLAISLVVTVWVARTLYTNGRIFLIGAFHENTPLADSVNHLLVVGFYLVNVGFVSIWLQSDATLTNLREAVQWVSGKIGIVLLVLGAIHFFNLFVFSRLQKQAREVERSGSQ